MPVLLLRVGSEGVVVAVEEEDPHMFSVAFLLSSCSMTFSFTILLRDNIFSVSLCSSQNSVVILVGFIDSDNIASIFFFMSLFEMNAVLSLFKSFFSNSSAAVFVIVGLFSINFL